MDVDILQMTLLASTPDATKTGLQLGPNYQAHLARWAWRLRTVQRISAKMRAQWATDLRLALEADLAAVLLEETAAKWINSGVRLPSSPTLNRYSTIAVRRALGPDAQDLLSRFQDASSGTNDRLPIEEYLRTSRTAQTTAQIVDQATTHFNQLIANNASKQPAPGLTGRTRWKTAAPQSRHTNLDGQIRPLGEAFNDNGRPVPHPRPRNGRPSHWSSCSCRLQYETQDGKWITP